MVGDRAELAPLALPAALAYRTPARDWQAVAVRVWPFAALPSTCSPTGTFPYHSFQGLAIPLSILAVQGVLSVWPRPRLGARRGRSGADDRARHGPQGARWRRTASGPPAIRTSCSPASRARSTRSSRPAARRRARARLRGAHAPVQDRPRGLRGRALVDAATGSERVDGDARAVRDGRLGRRGRARSCDAAARASCSSTAARACATSRSELRPLLEDVRRFGCATVYVLRRHAGTAARAEVRLAPPLRRSRALPASPPRRNPAQRRGADAAAASRIADGQVPYWDFWWYYPPGQPYLLGRPVGAVRAVAARVAGRAGALRRRGGGARLRARPLRGGALGAAGARELAGGGAGDGVPDWAAPVPAHARAGARCAAPVRAQAARWPACSRASPRRGGSSSPPISSSASCSRTVRPGARAAAPAGACASRAAAALAALVLYAPVVAAAGLGDSWDLLVRYPLRGLRRLPVAAVPARLRRAAEHRLDRRLLLRLRREPAAVLPAARAGARPGGLAAGARRCASGASAGRRWRAPCSRSGWPTT